MSRWMLAGIPPSISRLEDEHVFLAEERVERTTEDHSRGTTKRLRSSEAGSTGFTTELERELQHKLQEMSSKLENAQKENQTLVRLRENLKSRNQQLESINSKAETNLHLLGIRTNKLQQDLEACKDDLFHLQPMIQVTDADIRSQYEGLCEQISSWVEEEISAFERENGVLLAGTQIISDDGNRDVQEILRADPEAAEYLVISIIH